MPDAAKMSLTEGTAPAAPSAGNLVVYAKTDHEVYVKDPNGNERGLGTSGTAFYAGTAGFATTAANSGSASSATTAGNAGSSSYATSAGNAGSSSSATTAAQSGTSSYATTSGQAGTSVLATSAGNAGSSSTAADNTANAQIANTAFAKSQDAVLHRESEQEVFLTAAAIETMKVAHNTNIDMATNSFDFGGKFRLASWTAATMLLSKITGGAGYSLEVLVTTGYLKVTLNALTFTTATAPGFVAGTRHKIKVKVSVGATQTTVSIFIDGVLFETMTPQNNTTSLANASALYILGTSTAVHAGGVTEVEVDNATFTAAEVLDAYRNGIPESWKCGSQTNLIVNGADWTGATGVTPPNSWTANGAVTDFTIDGGMLKITAGENNAGIYQNFTVIPVKKYKYNFIYKNTAGDQIQYRVYDSTNGANIVAFTDVASSTTNASFSVAVDAPAGCVSMRVYITGKTNADIIWVDDVNVNQLGPTLALTPESWQQDKPYDLSSNNLTVSYPATGWTLTKPPVRKIKQPTPTAKTTAATLTIAELLTGILTGTHSAGSTQAYTLPTGTLCDAWPAFGIDDYFEWTLINLSAAAADTITVTAGADHTLVGEGIVQSAHASTGQLYGNSAKFRTRKTGANVFVTYRVG